MRRHRAEGGVTHPKGHSRLQANLQSPRPQTAELGEPPGVLRCPPPSLVAQNAPPPTHLHTLIHTHLEKPAFRRRLLGGREKRGP